jgi:uncharacterized protein YkwD
MKMVNRPVISWSVFRTVCTAGIVLFGFIPASAQVQLLPYPPAENPPALQVEDSTASYSALKPGPVFGAPTTPQSWPADPTSDITWLGGYGGVADIQTAFNHAHTQENTQLGLSLPMFTLPSQSEWNAMSDGEKAFWLINHERQARNVTQLQGVEANVTSVAQNYANYLMAHNAFNHTADGHDPYWRLNANPTINACHDFLPVVENLAAFMTSGSSISLPVERSVYGWMYEDGGNPNYWGHRHAILYYPYNENGGLTDREGFLGIGRAHGPYLGWNFGEVIVMNVFDPCSTWVYNIGSIKCFLPVIVR